MTQNNDDILHHDGRCTCAACVKLKEATGRWVEYTQPQAVERRRELAEEQADREFNYDAEDEYL